MIKTDLKGDVKVVSLVSQSTEGLPPALWLNCKMSLGFWKSGVLDLYIERDYGIKEFQEWLPSYIRVGDKKLDYKYEAYPKLKGKKIEIVIEG